MQPYIISILIQLWQIRLEKKNYCSPPKIKFISRKPIVSPFCFFFSNLFNTLFIQICQFLYLFFHICSFFLSRLFRSQNLNLSAFSIFLPPIFLLSLSRFFLLSSPLFLRDLLHISLFPLYRV